MIESQLRYKIGMGFNFRVDFNEKNYQTCYQQGYLKQGFNINIMFNQITSAGTQWSQMSSGYFHFFFQT